MTELGEVPPAAASAPAPPTELGPTPEAPSTEPAAEQPTPEPAVEAPAPQEPAPDLAALLGSAMAHMDERFATLDVRVAEVARLGARDRDLVDRLHAENQTLRAGELHQAQAPLLRDLIRLHDDLERLEAASEDGEDLALVRGQLVAVLARAGADRFSPGEGDAFDAAQHQGRGAVPTEDAARDKRVARLVRSGFRREGRVIRPAEVEVFTLVVMAQDAPAAAGGQIDREGH